MHMVSASAPQQVMPPDSWKAIQVWVEKGPGSQRQLWAIVEIPHPIEQVWQVLTDYERMPDFIPNLLETQRVAHPDGGIRIEQVGYCRVFKLRVTARIVLDITEQFPGQIAFQMVEGDFQQFSGFCQLESLGNVNTQLRYAIEVVPRFTLPVALLEHQLRQDLPMNLWAIRQRVDTLFGAKQIPTTELEP